MISLRADASSLEAKLQQVKLDSKGAPSKGSSSSAFSPQTGSLLSSVLAGDAREASMRQCFSAAFDAEVNYLTSLNIELTKDRRRQILADILVWAEVTQQHYDATTRRSATMTACAMGMVIGRTGAVTSPPHGAQQQGLQQR
ncbi:hypothetical protein V8C86DRAFT_1562800 [Haematococcus lacustris]